MLQAPFIIVGVVLSIIWVIFIFTLAIIIQKRRRARRDVQIMTAAGWVDEEARVSSGRTKRHMFAIHHHQHHHGAGPTIPSAAYTGPSTIDCPPPTYASTTGGAGPTTTCTSNC